MLRLLCLVLAIAALPVAAQSRRAQPIEIDRVVAVVNDEAITAHELGTKLDVIARQMAARNVQMPPRETLEKQVLERLITDRVQLQLAKETGLRIADVELDTALRRIAENNRLSMADFRAAIERDGIAWTRFREDIRDELTLSRLREREVDSRIAITDGEIDNYLANPDQGEEDNPEVQLAHIVIRVPEQASPDQLMRLGARAQGALDEVRRGGDFAKVAAATSDAADASSGGAMGTRPLDRLPELYADAVRKLKPGETSEVLRSPAGFHIVKLVARAGGKQAAPNTPLKQTRARHILIKVNEIVSADEARHKLVGLKDRLDHGGDFAELARLYSNDLSATKGGDLGWLYQGDTVPEFERAMDALLIGEISAPIQSPFGYHLIQVQERRTEEASKERQRLVARQVLRERKADEAYQDWVRQIRDRAYVEYRDQER